MLTLSDLERAVLEAIAEQESEHSSALREQIAFMQVTGRENTGHGFYTAVWVNGGPHVNASSPLGPIAAAVEGVEHGMGFLLWLTDRRATSLEGYTYDGDLTGIDLTSLKFSDVGPRFRS